MVHVVEERREGRGTGCRREKAGTWCGGLEEVKDGVFFFFLILEF